MLYVVGIGLHPRHVSIAALEAIKKCEKAYAELYIDYPISVLKKLVGKEIKILKRWQIKGEELLEEAKQEEVALLFPGSPFEDKVHLSLLLKARERKIKTEVIEGISVWSAVSKVGLLSKRFGRICRMLRYWEESEGSIHMDFPLRSSPSSYWVIKENRKADLHTLVILDLSIKEALERLLRTEEIEQRNVINEREKIVGIARLGWPNERIIYARLRELMKIRLGGGPKYLIFPARLSDAEEKALEAWKHEEQK